MTSYTLQLYRQIQQLEDRITQLEDALELIHDHMLDATELDPETVVALVKAMIPERDQ